MHRVETDLRKVLYIKRGGERERSERETILDSLVVNHLLIISINLKNNGGLSL